MLQRLNQHRSHGPIFFQSEHVSSQIWCQKIFPLLEGGDGPSTKKFFFQSEHVSSQIWCQKFFPLLGGGRGPLTKNFFPFWTCIKPNLVSKIFPFTETGTPHPPPPHPRLDQVPPSPPIQGWIRYPPPRSKAGSGTSPPPSKAGSGTPPPQVWIDTQSENITSRHPSDAGGKNENTTLKLSPYRTVEYTGTFLVLISCQCE